MIFRVLYPDMPKLESVIPILNRVHNSGRFSNYGPIEKLYREQIGRKLRVDPDRIATCANATIGIQGICSLLALEEWTVQNWTFPATGLAVQNSRSRIWFADVNLRTWTVNQKSIHKSKSGLISTIPFGARLKIDSNLSKGFHIIDAAASLGNFDDLSNIEKNMAVIISLHATKILGCGEGGLVIFGDAELAKEFRSWTNFGFSGERDSLIFGATNGKLSEISCAYALANLQEFSEKKYRYIELRKKVNSISRDLGILPEVMDDNRVSPYWIVHFESIERRNLVERILNESGVETRRWWPKPLSQMPAFSGEQFESAAEVNSSYLAGTTLGLPFHLKLSDLDIHEIASRLESALV